jgi:hypothetical protein
MRRLLIEMGRLFGSNKTWLLYAGRATQCLRPAVGNVLSVLALASSIFLQPPPRNLTGPKPVDSSSTNSCTFRLYFVFRKQTSHWNVISPPRIKLPKMLDFYLPSQPIIGHARVLSNIQRSPSWLAQWCRKASNKPLATSVLPNVTRRQKSGNLLRKHTSLPLNSSWQ